MTDQLKVIIEATLEGRKAKKEAKVLVDEIKQQAKIKFGVELSDKEVNDALKKSAKLAQDIEKQKLKEVQNAEKAKLKEIQVSNKAQESEAKASQKTQEAISKSISNERKRLAKVDLAQAKAINKQLLDEYNWKTVGVNNKSKLSFDFQTFLNENDKIKQSSTRVKELQESIKNVNNQGDLRKVTSQVNAFKSEMAATNKVGRSFMSENLKNLGKVTSWITLTTVFFGVTRSIKDMVTNVYELDKSMISLRKVTNETDATYARFLDRTSESAKELGTTISGLVESTADFARLGFSLSSAEELGKIATLYKNVGDLDLSEATQNIISISKAYSIQSDQAITIVDKLNEVGKVYCPAA